MEHILYFTELSPTKQAYCYQRHSSKLHILAFHYQRQTLCKETLSHPGFVFFLALAVLHKRLEHHYRGSNSHAVKEVS